MQADDGRVVSNFIAQLLSGHELTIYGDGSQTRCFCFVDDTVEGLLRLMDSSSAVGMPVNLGDPREMTVRELAVMIIGLTGAHSHIVEQPLPEDDPRRRRPDITRAIELLDWQPQTSLEEGLRKTIAWFEQQLAHEPHLIAAE
jgi:UDP-glucuronate decarboxylase